MFGYLESEYRLLERSSCPPQNTSNVMLHYELRQSVCDSKKLPYIAVYSNDSSGEIITDHLFFYSTIEFVQSDWGKLIGPNVVKLDDLEFEEHIENHCVGCTKSGSIIMY